MAGNYVVRMGEITIVFLKTMLNTARHFSKQALTFCALNLVKAMGGLPVCDSSLGMMAAKLERIKLLRSA
jgi:hypothetical protein